MTPPPKSHKAQVRNDHSTSATLGDLIGLAERMGIPTEDAAHHVLTHLTDKQLSHDKHRAAPLSQTDERPR